jgi:DnaK suppressor protein
MNETTKIRIKTQIQELIEETRQDLAEQVESQKAIAPDNAIGRISRMDAMYNNQVNEATLTRTRERLAKLEYLLPKVDEPGFGKCERCMQEINEKRLMAIPESTLCVRCASY